MTQDDLLITISKLHDLQASGWLEGVEHEIFVATRGPREDVARFPQYELPIQSLARDAARILKVPFRDCVAAASKLLLPTTREAIVMGIINEAHARLREAEHRAMRQKRGSVA